MVDPSVRTILTLAGRDNVSYNTPKHVIHMYIQTADGASALLLLQY